MPVDRALHQTAWSIGCRQVQRHRDHAVKGVEVLRAARSGDDEGALGHKRLGDGETNSLVRSCHDGDLVRELEIHDRSFLSFYDSSVSANTHRDSGDEIRGPPSQIALSVSRLAV